MDIAGMYGNLVVSPHQVDLREETTTGELVGIVMNMTDGVSGRE
jgi:hypothetical protein